MKTESDLTSCEVQRDICVQFAKARGLQILEERFDDEGVSGATLDRPALNRLLGLVRVGQVGAVMVQRLDRLSRRVLDCTSLLEDFKARGVGLFVAAMPELADGAFDTLVLNLLSSFAEFEREMIASRIADRRVGLIARGRRIAGVTPFGYSTDPKSKQLVPVPEEAAVVRELFALVEKGVLPSEIASIAAERDWRTRSGRLWTARQILDTVGNPVYAGRFRSEGGTRPGVHQPIVSDDAFNRCAEIVKARRTGPSEPRARPREWSHLQGKVRCARCGQMMSIRTTLNGSRRHVYFRCRRAVGAAKPCSGTQVRAYEIEQLVRSVLLAPTEHLPRKRGRPTKGGAALVALAEVLPMLTPPAERMLIRQVTDEIAWDADAGRVRLSFNRAALRAGFLVEREVVISVCTLAPESQS